MWLTGIISYPLALILDFTFSQSKQTYGMLTSDQLALLIRFHEKSEDHGGELSKDAARVMLGALSLDGRRIDRVNVPEQSADGDEKDVEKAVHPVVHGMIVKWYAVKTIDINEPVDRYFMEKIRGWSYSRIPVIGKSAKTIAESRPWQGTMIYGFLHIKVKIIPIITPFLTITQSNKSFNTFSLSALFINSSLKAFMRAHSFPI